MVVPPLIDGLKWKILLKSYENWWFRGRNILGNLQIVRKLLGTSTKHPSPRGKKSFGGQANSQICQAAFLGESSTMEKSWVTSAETRPGQVYLVYIPPINYGYSIHHKPWLLELQTNLANYGAPFHVSWESTFSLHLMLSFRCRISCKDWDSFLATPIGLDTIQAHISIRGSLHSGMVFIILYMGVFCRLDVSSASYSLFFLNCEK